MNKKILSTTLYLLTFFQSKGYILNEVLHTKKVPTNIECILGVDIGDTNCDFGIFQVKSNKPILLFSLHTKTQEITNFTKVICKVLNLAKEKYAITIKNACIGAPGHRSENRDYCKGGGYSFAVDGNEIKKESCLEVVFVLNDFEIIGYGIDHIDPKKIIQINEGKHRATSPIAIIGAGTGLGASYMIWNAERKHYFSIESQLGCIDFCPRDQLEFSFYKETKPEKFNSIIWNNVLGGCGGVVAIRNFLSRRQPGASNENLEAKEIFARYKKDQLCTDAVNMYLRLYARFAKIAALSICPHGGLYIVGGIVAKNAKLFNTGIFLKEFLNEPKSSSFHTLFKNTPLYLVTDYNVSLYGAAQYLLHELA